MDTNLETNDLTKKIRAIFNEGLAAAEVYLSGILANCINSICDEYDEQLKSTGEKYEFNKSIAGFSPEQLNLFIEKYYAEGVDEWIDEGADGLLDELIIRFMHFREKNRVGVRKRFPCTFQKWSAQDDEDLRAIWTRTDQDNVKWEDLEEMFGRPRNAIKIRLEKLGFTLAEPAVRRYS